MNRYGDNDADCPYQVAEWLVKFLDARSRLFQGAGHEEACTVDQEQFLRELFKQ